MFSSRATFVLGGFLASTLCTAAPSWAAWPTDGKDMCTAAFEQSYPAAISDDVGGAVVVWQDTRGGNPRLYVQRVTAAGAISPGWPNNGAAVCSATGDQKGHSVARDGSGGAFITWEDYRAGGVETDIYIQRITASGNPASGWPAEGVALCTSTGGQGYPRVVFDGAGAIVAWQDYRGSSHDIYAQRVNAAGAPQWAANGLALCAEVGHQKFPAIVSDAAGGAIVCWEDGRAGNPDIYAQRINAAGAAQWSTGGIALCSAGLDQLTPRIIAGPANGAIVTWDDYRDYNADIYAQQVNGAGAILWTANGVGVCTDLAEQYGTNPVSDGAGGVIVPWNDFRNNSGDVLLQRITAAGAVAPGWPVNGKAACTVSGNQFDPVAVSDDAGGVILSWDDFRITRPSYEIYAQRITGTGSVAQGWPSQGQLVCGAANDQLQPAIAPDLAGGAIVAWYDYRSGPADIYAYRVMASGGSSTVDVPPMEPTDLGLVQAFPNPMRVRTEIRLRLTAGEHVTLDVVDLAGRRIRSLADDQWLDAGVHAYGWDGRDVSGSRAPGGVYLIAVRAGNRFAVRKLALID